MGYQHPIFRQVDFGEMAFCMHCRQFVLTGEAVVQGWTCPECGPELTSPWDVRPYWVGVISLLEEECNEGK